MSSGVEVTEACISAFQDMKIPDSSKPRNRCIIFKISDDKKKIEIEKTILKNEQEQEVQYNEIVEGLPPRDGRYIVWDLLIANAKSGKENDKLVFMSWSPDDAPVQSRMIFASSKDAIKKKLQIGLAVDCSDKDEASYKEVCEKCKQ